MKCLYCGAPTTVTNSRQKKKEAGTWRRRQCTGCGASFTTAESPDLAKSLVVEMGSRLEAFERDKLLLSIYKALGHRKDPTGAASAISGTVLTRLIKEADHGKISRLQIIEATTDTLHRFDAAAAVHYRAYHPSN